MLLHCPKFCVNGNHSLENFSYQLCTIPLRSLCFKLHPCTQAALHGHFEVGLKYLR